MAIYHLNMKAISRAGGRSATGAAAYRAGIEITDRRTGLTHDYRRKAGVLYAELILPRDGCADRAEFWNAVETHHKRGDAVLAREIEVSLPHEISDTARQQLALSYARELAGRYGCAVDLALHEPSKSGDRRNWHAHLLLTACAVGPDGTLGRKLVELDPIACARKGPGREPTQPPVDRERPRWALLVNQALAAAGRQERVDHRSHEARGIDVAPSIHLGPAATHSERQGHRTRLGDVNRGRQSKTEKLREERLGLARLRAEMDAGGADQQRRRTVRRPGRLQNEQRQRAGRENNGPSGHR